MKILDVIEGKVVITPECLCISPFSEIWSNDKTKDKIQANQQIKYVWFFSDFNSPYYKFPEDERKAFIIKDIIKDSKFTVTSQLKEAIETYKRLHSSPAIAAVDAAFTFMNKIQDYFKTVDLEEVDAKKITDIFINMPKIVASLNEARKAAAAEETSATKVRGGATVGLFEDK
jgi:ACT domain-containing protein